MAYRRPNPTRIKNQQVDMLRHAGQTATWRQFVSAETGLAIVGMGETYYYREQTITAVMGQYFLPVQGEGQRAGGLVVTGMFNVTTREQLDNRDELTWNNVTYRIAGDSTRSKLGNTWLTPVVRGSGE